MYYLPESSSLRRAIIEVFEEQEDASTNDNYLKDQLNKKNNNHSILIILERIKNQQIYMGQQFLTILRNQKLRRERKLFYGMQMKYVY